MHDHFMLLAAYNRWANTRLYAAVAGLDDAAYRLDRKGFFGSIHGTLNHIMVGDRAWLGRIEGYGDTPAGLDAILYDDFAALRAAREAEDERLVRVIDGLNEGAIAAPLSYRNYRGETCSEPLWQVLDHVFNHQTHHRGQAHDMLNQAGIEPPELDLIYFVRETAP
jgi:uncharacterized damage-inducible protein DinB